MSVVILVGVCFIGFIFDSFIGTKNSLCFLVAALITLGASFFFGDVVKLRLYVEHGRYHIHHALYGIIFLGVDVLIFNSNLFVLGIVWGLLLSEAKFFITEKRRKHAPVKTDQWLIAEADFPSLQNEDIIRRFVKPIVDEFDGRFITFHFFFEREFLLRLKAEEMLLTESVIPFIDHKLTELNAANRSLRVDAGYTEERDYADGWPLALRIFEIGSRLAILKAEASVGNVVAGPQLNEGKFVHLLLNQSGYATDREASFHFEAFVERLEMLFSGSNLGLVTRKHRQIFEKVRNNFAQPIAELVNRRITEPEAA